MFLEIKDVVKRYSDFELSLSMNIKEGKIIGIIGPNGAGKSTLFKAILGLIKLDQGTISEVDKNLLGVVLSDRGFSEYLTMNEIKAILKKLYTSFDEQLFDRMVLDYQLPLNKKINTFSTGMKAKVKFIVALSHKSELLILDEPTSGLDVFTRDEMLDALREYMNQSNRSILISSHISSDLENLCDEVYLIYDGKIVFYENSDVLRNDYAILKMTKESYAAICKDYILKVIHKNHEISCLTNQKQFYLENYPNIIVENCHIDDVLMHVVRGE